MINLPLDLWSDFQVYNLPQVIYSYHIYSSHVEGLNQPEVLCSFPLRLLTYTINLAPTS